MAQISLARRVAIAGLEESGLLDDSADRPTQVDPSHVLRPLLVVMTDSVPGHKITAVFGLVTGVTGRARNVLSDAGSELKSLFGGELGGATKMVVAARQLAHERIAGEARAVGANAVVGVRFDTESLGSGGSQSSAVVAHGTAVRVEAVGD